MISNTMKAVFCFKSTKYKIPDIEYWMLTELRIPYNDFDSNYETFLNGLKGAPYNKEKIAHYINDFFKIEPAVKRSFLDKDKTDLKNVLDVIMFETTPDGVMSIALNHDYLKDTYVNQELLNDVPVMPFETIERTISIQW